MSPFKALYGEDCLTPLKLSDPLISVPAAKEMLEEMDLQLKLIRENLKVASDRQIELCRSKEVSKRVRRRRDGILKSQAQKEFFKTRQVQKASLQILWALSDHQKDWRASL